MSNLKMDTIPCVGCKYLKTRKLPFSTNNLHGCINVHVGALKYMLMFSRGGECEHRTEVA